jgi:biotin carboxyl carrier protein
MSRFDELGLDELSLSVDGTQVELTSSGKPPVVAAPADAVHEVLAPSVGFPRAIRSVGSEVGAEDVVCLLEVWTSTMEVKAGIDGTVLELHVDEGAMAEYGQALLSIRPA